MDKYIICYNSSIDHDCCKVWLYAKSKEDAEFRAKREYWDIEKIIYIKKD